MAARGGSSADHRTPWRVLWWNDPRPKHDYIVCDCKAHDTTSKLSWRKLVLISKYPGGLCLECHKPWAQTLSEGGLKMWHRLDPNGKSISPVRLYAAALPLGGGAAAGDGFVPSAKATKKAKAAAKAQSTTIVAGGTAGPLWGHPWGFATRACPHGTAFEDMPRGQVHVAPHSRICHEGGPSRHHR